MQSIGLKFPFIETNDGGIIGYTKIDSEAIKSNLIAFLTLRRGQRVMNNSLYSPLYDYIMEQWDEINEDKLTGELKEKLQSFFPEIEVGKINFVFEEETNFLHLKLSYYILDLKIEDSVSVTVIIQP